MKKLFKKADEMEMHINQIAVKWAWFYTVLFLSAWAFYNQSQTGDGGGLPFILLISQNLIFLGLQQYLKWKWSKDEE